MADLLKNAAQWLHERRHAKLASDVVYQRAAGGSPLTIKATRGREIGDQVVEAELTANSNQTDWIVRKSDLLVVGVFVEPKRLDTVTVDSQVWEVAEIAGEPCWRYSDEFENAVRIHTVRV